ncbi:MAG: deoxyuridine 5'-triphosphate nucleotidohydrolase [Clostridiales bacterium 43-6]|nr:MAG: deoxyuridine 5'-triphosphate nucleotidohydrolase [Clostridiales bacterium 43-6]
MKLTIKKLDEHAILPTRATEGSAGMDLYALSEEEQIIKAGERVSISTGIAISLPSKDYVALVFARSGLSTKHGITLANCVGVIDSDYRGEIKVALINQSKEDYRLQPKERIAQLCILPVLGMEIEEVQELDETRRGAGGFGSTGK